MTDTERQFLISKCGKLLQDVLVEIRTLTWEEGNAKQVNDLADLTHNLPEWMVGRDEYVMNYLRAGFVNYAKKYFPDIDPECHRYVALLDMDEATFTDLYCRTSWPWPEPAAARHSA